MSRTLTILVAISLMLSFPLALAEEDQDNPPEEATWGLCTAEEESQDGDEASNGTVSSTPPFNQTSEEDCEETKHPRNQTRDRANETAPGPEDNRGDDERSEDRNQTASDDRSEEDRSEDRREDRADDEDQGGEDRAGDKGENGSD